MRIHFWCTSIYPKKTFWLEGVWVMIVFWIMINAPAKRVEVSYLVKRESKMKAVNVGVIDFKCGWKPRCALTVSAECGGTYQALTKSKDPLGILYP